jgi:predicted hotdog family 3-hydroxylacyl-ACP dehydratase
MASVKNCNYLSVNIEDLLPHRGRILLIDEILEVGHDSAVTCATVTDRWPFFDGSGVDSLVLIEVVAQTAGINNGWVRIQKHGLDSEKKGWLVGIKQARFFVDKLALNARIITRAENQFEYQGYRQILGTASIDSQTVGEVALQVIQTERME